MKSHTQIHPEIPQQKASAGAQRGYRSNIRPPAEDIFLSVWLSVRLSACLSVSNLSVFASLCLSIRPKTSSLYVLSSLLPDRPYSCVTTPPSKSGLSRPSFVIPPNVHPPYPSLLTVYVSRSTRKKQNNGTERTREKERDHEKQGVAFLWYSPPPSPGQHHAVQVSVCLRRARSAGCCVLLCCWFMWGGVTQAGKVWFGLEWFVSHLRYYCLCYCYVRGSFPGLGWAGLARLR